MTRFGFLVFVGASTLTACVSDRVPDDANRVAIPDASAIDAPSVTCTAGYIDCDNTCVRVAGDPLNCGSCGNACPQHVGCAVGRCDCNQPKVGCDGACVDPTMDHDNCGACGHACAATETCSLGMCVVECTDPGHAICVTTNSMTGTRMQACVDEQTDVDHCGSCTHRCTSGASCSAGACTCTSGDMCQDQCVDLQTDAAHCGTCYTNCGTGGVCADGACTACSTGLEACGSPAHCVNTMTNTLNCGTCGNVCPIGSACTDGACFCPGSGTACSASCVDLQTDMSNCGTCGTMCPASSTCTMGDCVCSGTLTHCGEICSDTTTDVDNCGGCGHSCGVGGVCHSGACTCGTGYMMCDAVSCTNVQSDAANCGSCGHACPAGDVCVLGGCVGYTATPVTSTTAPFIDACAASGSTTVLPNADDSAVLSPLPFAFRYWTTNLAPSAMINVCSNGWIGMDGSMNTSLGGSIPEPFMPNAVIAPHWGDDYTGPMGICIATVGTAPNRQWVVEWVQSGYCCGGGGGGLTYEVVLTETTNTIDLVYQTMTGARSQVSGIEDPTGAQGYPGCPDGTYECTPIAGSAMRFTPIP